MKDRKIIDALLTAGATIGGLVQDAETDRQHIVDLESSLEAADRCVKMADVAIDAADHLVEHQQLLIERQGKQIEFLRQNVSDLRKEYDKLAADLDRADAAHRDLQRAAKEPGQGVTDAEAEPPFYGRHFQDAEG